MTGIEPCSFVPLSLLSHFVIFFFFNSINVFLSPLAERQEIDELAERQNKKLKCIHCWLFFNHVKFKEQFNFRGKPYGNTYVATTAAHWVFLFSHFCHNRSCHHIASLCIVTHNGKCAANILRRLLKYETLDKLPTWRNQTADCFVA